MRAAETSEVLYINKNASLESKFVDSIFLGFRREDIRRLMSPLFTDPLDIVEIAKHVVNS